MMMPLARRLFGTACAILLTASVTPTADAFFYSPFGYSWGYSPYTTYYGGYGAYYGGYATGYRGYRYALYAPSYVSYGSAYCGSVCGTGCSSCGTSCCDPCGVSYGGFSCGSCGLNSCCSGCGLTGCGGGCGLTGCGFASNCTSSGDCGTGITPAAGTTEPKSEPNQQYSPPPTNKTYDPNSSSGSDFEQPARRSNPAPAGRTNTGGDELLPPTGGSGSGGDFGDLNGGGLFERGEANKLPADEPIKQRTDHAPTPDESSDDKQPADMEPSDETDDAVESETPQDVEVRPADIKTQVAAGISASRNRAQYSVRFHAPRVARVDVNPSSKWVPVEPDTKLAATK